MRVAAVALGNTATIVYWRAKLLVMEHPPGFKPLLPEDTLEGVIARERFDRQVRPIVCRPWWGEPSRLSFVGALLCGLVGVALAALALALL
jgi:hypothetical protein